MNVISNVLYWISTGMMVPVIVLLIFFFIRSLLLLGAFFSQYVTQKKVCEEICEKVKHLSPDTLNSFEQKTTEGFSSILGLFVNRIIAEKNNEAKVDLILAEYEMEAEKNISASKVLTKMGPILGLMGTLIPMGPALVGLATGDVASMAYNMQIAFATTVVGLTVSGIGYITQQVKERWALRNFTALEYLAQLVKQYKL